MIKSPWIHKIWAFNPLVTQFSLNKKNEGKNFFHENCWKNIEEKNPGVTFSKYIVCKWCKKFMLFSVQTALFVQVSGGAHKHNFQWCQNLILRCWTYVQFAALKGSLDYYHFCFLFLSSFAVLLIPPLRQEQTCQEWLAFGWPWFSSNKHSW